MRIKSNNFFPGLATLLLAIICLLPAIARRQAAPVISPAANRHLPEGPAEADTVTISLLTCGPGREIFELCGHEAVRVRYASGADTVWNYGLFSFEQPNFVYRFVKGETDYMAGCYPTRYFLPEYVASGRWIVEQDLNLTPALRDTLLRLLRRDVLPENRVYRYNYVRDNCATRIVDRLEEAAGETILIPDTIKYGTWRKEMRAYHADYPWYQFGIDLALGGGLDRPLRSREEMFVPMEMMDKLENARWHSGEPVVKATRILNEGRRDATLPPTPFWLTPLFWSWIVFLSAVILAVVMIRRKRVIRWPYALWFGLTGIAGCVIAFLVFISEHEATTPNLLLLWLNPLQLLIPAFIYCRRMWRLPARIVLWYDTIVLTVLLIVWPFQMQSANQAFFPLMATSLLLSAIYLGLARYLKE